MREFYISIIAFVMTRCMSCNIQKSSISRTITGEGVIHHQVAHVYNRGNNGIQLKV